MPSPSLVVARMPAKINIGLSVGPRRPDGFHELQTVFAAVERFDTVHAVPADKLSLTVTGVFAEGVPTDRTNLAWRAAERMGVKAAVSVDKRIPVAAGLAGGSADAAGALLVGARLTDREHDLAAIAAELGSDVAFLLEGGLAVGEGRGERLRSLDGPPLHWALAVADHGLSTPAVYAELDRLRPDAPEPSVGTDLIDAVQTGDPHAVAPLLRNDLQPAAISLAPHLADTLQAGLDLGALGALVSGSGPTCLFLAADRTHAEQLATQLRPHCHTSFAAQSGARPKIAVKD